MKSLDATVIVTNRQDVIRRLKAQGYREVDGFDETPTLKGLLGACVGRFLELVRFLLVLAIASITYLMVLKYVFGIGFQPTEAVPPAEVAHASTTHWALVNVSGPEDGTERISIAPSEDVTASTEAGGAPTSRGDRSWSDN